MAVVVDPQRQLLVSPVLTAVSVGVIVAFKPELRERALARGLFVEVRFRCFSARARRDMNIHLSFWRAANRRFRRCAWRRNEKRKIVKQNDYLMNATRYLILSGLQVACREPREEAADEQHWIDSTRSAVSVWRRGPHKSSIPARRLGTLYSGIERTDQFPHQSTT
jgi:hypothetical protein